MLDDIDRSRQSKYGKFSCRGILISKMNLLFMKTESLSIYILKCKKNDDLSIQARTVVQNIWNQDLAYKDGNNQNND